jgi:hypothetical protein
MLRLVIVLLLTANAAFAQVSPFMTTTWDQTCNYNADCPAVGSGGACGKAYTGCNATAIGQIFRYYSHPSNTIGGTYCNEFDAAHCVDFDVQSYNYALMPDNVTSANPEVARMLYQIGVAVDMQWSGTSSNSFFAPEAMKRFFAYSPRMKTVANFSYPTTEERIAALKAELDAGRPVMAKGGSHFYLIDGYNSTDEFHMNFGWSGMYNGYYPITAVTNGAGSFTPTNYIIGIEPMNGDLETAADTIFLPASGGANNTIEFTSLSDWTVSSSDSWISFDMSSGTRGYYAYPDGSTFDAIVNNGGVRYGYIFITNATGTDTIVVKQDASPLQIEPGTLSFPAAGGTQTVAVSYYAGSPWSLSPAGATWISAAPSTGSGNGTIAISVLPNTSTAPRSTLYLLSAGAYWDTISVLQEGAAETAGLEQKVQAEIVVWPNPAADEVNVIFGGEIPAQLVLTDPAGRIVLVQKPESAAAAIDLSAIPAGTYLLQADGKVTRLVKEH